jgi:carboxylesterase type B
VDQYGEPMRARRILVAVAALAVVAAGCDFPNINPPGSAPQRYRDAIYTAAQVVKTADVTYGSAEDLSHTTITLKLDVYAPPASDRVTRRPAVVWIHGGSFRSGDKTSPEIVDEATTFAQKGYVNFSINYRLEPPGCPPITATCIAAIQEAMADGQTAIAWVRTHASTYGVDTSRIAVAGTSAGAITAAHVGYLTSETPASAVRAAVSLSGADFFGPIGPGDAPALFFHGTADPLVQYQWAADTVKNAQAAHLDAFLETWPNEGHVPYVQHRDQILTQTRNFLWWEMDLAHAAT